MILPLEKQVCSLDLARRLKELGAPQESLFYYVDTRKSWKGYNCPPRSNMYEDPVFVPFHDLPQGDPELELHLGLEKALAAREGYNKSEPLSAYTSSELGEMLPEQYFTRKHLGSGTQRWHWQIYSTFEEDMIKGELLYGHGHTSDTEADARAKMLIYLLEHKLINL